LSEPPGLEQDDDGNDEFQVQATPPHLVSSTARKLEQGRAAAADDASTDTASEDEDDSRRVERPSSPVVKSTLAKSAAAGPRLGTIGKKAQARTELPPSPVIEKDAALVEQDIAASETASDIGDNDGESAAATPPSSGRPKQRTPVKPRLGHVGDDVKRTTAGQLTATEHGEQHSTDNAALGRPKLGIIGKGKNAGVTVKTSSALPDERGRSDAKEVGPGPRETSTERADRRREELKRELERKAAAGPIKKKRKF
jgi:hypothetical protein